MAKTKKARIYRKKKSGAKRVFITILSAVLLIILTAMLFVFINERFIKWDFIPTSADIVHFFGGGKPYVKPLDNEAAVYFIDVGQGDCELIRSKDCSILIDCGEDERVDDVVGFIKYSGVERLDYVIATHPHSDHIGGMYRILEKFDVGTVILPSLPESVVPESYFYRKMLDVIERKGISFEYAEPGKKYELGEKTSLEIMAPLNGNYEDLNNFSITARFTHGGNSFLFTGDIESPAERDILDNGLDVQADVLKVAHHGSEGSSSPAFLDKVKPRIAVIEVAKVNEYGHPSAEVFERLGQVGCKEIYTTAVDGNIVIVSDGAFLKVKTETAELAAAA